MARVELHGVTRCFGLITAVRDLDLEIADGEFFCLVGPSGCGKTTTLRLLAGFERLDQGEILFDGERVNEVPPQQRNVGLVYQTYALFPTMSVWKNVAYGLVVRKLRRREIEQRVQEALKLVALIDLADRKPSQLSGGQQQRVALARALVIRPRLLLLDEPLSSIDAQLRVGIRREIQRIQRELSITTLYVTHDQEEALSLGDRIGVMRAGHLEQVGKPLDIYFRPQTAFVAKFLGQTTLLEGRLEVMTPETAVVIVGEGLRLPVKPTIDLLPQDRVWCSIRPEALVAADESSPPRGAVSLVATVIDLEFLGSVTRVEISVSGLGPHLFLEFSPRQSAPPTRGASLRVWVDPASLSYGPLGCGSGR